LQREIARDDAGIGLVDRDGRSEGMGPGVRRIEEARVDGLNEVVLVAGSRVVARLDMEGQPVLRLEVALDADVGDRAELGFLGGKLAEIHRSQARGVAVDLDRLVGESGLVRGRLLGGQAGRGGERRGERGGRDRR